MDPNVTLAELRSLASGCLHSWHAESPDGRPQGWADDAVEALERLTELDEFLTRGGFIPAAWARS